MISNLTRALTVTALLASLSSAHAEDELLPGPCLEKRKEISVYLNKAKKAGFGTKPYEDALKQIDVQIQNGASEDDVNREVLKLVGALRDQVGNFKSLKSSSNYHSVSATSSPSSGGKASRESQAVVMKPNSELESRLLDLVNRHRQEAGLPALRPNSSLAQIARAHAEDMCKRKYFGHVNPEGLDSNGRARAAGYPQPVRENINYTSLRQDSIATVEAADNSLFHSPGHKANMLSTDVSLGGMGIAYNSHGTIFVCELFSPE
ncbi:MAG: CAP domain-containing protein [Candidatus Obscuribacterales bacterium]|nr:CAP domain-containing protein [Candidatus Obscuribacterales bacterium]